MGSGRILGISLGTRKVGLAILKRRFIPFCASKAFQETWSDQKLQRIIFLIERYITAGQINYIAIKIPTVTVVSPKLIKLQASIEQLGKEKGIEVYIYTMTECKEALGLHKRANKKACMDLLVERFPALQNKYEREMKSRTNHYDKLFEAVAVADALYKRLGL